MVLIELRAIKVKIGKIFISFNLQLRNKKIVETFLKNDFIEKISSFFTTVENLLKFFWDTLQIYKVQRKFLICFSS